MKRFINLFVVWVMIVVMASCKKEAAVLYSCDPVVQRFVSGASWEGISREELSNYQIDTLIAIFRSLSNENKAAIWRAKMDLLIATESFGEAEITFIEGIRDAITPDLYLSTPDSKVIVDSLENRMKEMSSLYSWAEDDALYYFTLPHDRTQLIYYIQKAHKEGGGVSAGSNDCSCNFSMNRCRLLDYRTCANYGCSVVASGCGFLLMNSCDGHCY